MDVKNGDRVRMKIGGSRISTNMNGTADMGRNIDDDTYIVMSASMKGYHGTAIRSVGGINFLVSVNDLMPLENPAMKKKKELTLQAEELEKKLGELRRSIDEIQV